jgi:hypothetical protein
VQMGFGFHGTGGTVMAKRSCYPVNCKKAS